MRLQQHAHGSNTGFSEEFTDELQTGNEAMNGLMEQTVNCGQNGDFIPEIGLVSPMTTSGAPDRSIHKRGRRLLPPAVESATTSITHVLFVSGERAQRDRDHDVNGNAVSYDGTKTCGCQTGLSVGGKAANVSSLRAACGANGHALSVGESKPISSGELVFVASASVVDGEDFYGESAACECQCGHTQVSPWAPLHKRRHSRPSGVRWISR